MCGQLNCPPLLFLVQTQCDLCFQQAICLKQFKQKIPMSLIFDDCLEQFHFTYNFSSCQWKKTKILCKKRNFHAISQRGSFFPFSGSKINSYYSPFSAKTSNFN
ncbi:hypothetical protein CLOSTMETH_00587 [[Clostridium] methylpentosum DSM 5476]|uniref:Uncharacterized protein n=1 Tax=[Clostridium] methylpentosum DSM 5476 TaxID=537013 RepID=C0E9T6_9FIRM|nr:hypothetical protein CLOSTMETH_00587 [[Clostridium] methylpentosum DSM 5476]